MIDPRTGYEYAPSASGMERLALCPGSFALESGMPDHGSDDSEKGVRVHAMLAWKLAAYCDDNAIPRNVVPDCEEIPQDEKDFTEELFAKAIGLFDEMIPAEKPAKIDIEHRLPYVQHGQLVFTGQPDFVALWPHRALVADYKTGWGDVTDSDENLQMRALAVLVAREYRVTQVKAAILQTGKKVKIVTYRYTDLFQATTEILKIVGDTKAPDAPLRPSPKACRHCKAKTVCPALSREIEQVQSMSIKTISGEALSVLYREKVKLAEQLIKAIQEETFRRLCEDPESVPGLSLDCSKPRVSDAEKLWEHHWLKANDKLTESGRAKSGARDEAKAAWKKSAGGLIATKTIERREWKDSDEVAAMLSSELPEETYRRIAGRIVVNKE